MYHLNLPNLSKLEKKYINDTFDKGWLSSSGKHTQILEKKVSKFIGVKYCVAVQSGTAALHAALLGMGANKNSKLSHQIIVVYQIYHLLNNVIHYLF